MATIPLAPLDRIREQLVGGLHRQEADGVGALAIRVVALREATMGGLDLGHVGAMQDAQDSIRIGARLDAGHALLLVSRYDRSPSGARLKRGTAVAASPPLGDRTTGW
jgi:hypothetical protein